MKKRTIYFSALIILISCTKDLDETISNNNSGEEETNYYFRLNETQINSSSSETEFTINITTNADWEIVIKPDWVVFSPESGSQNVKLKLTVLENTNPRSRNGEVRFKSLGQNYILNISQQSFPLSLVSYSGSESPIKMSESKYLLFNKPITLNSIISGDDIYLFLAGPNDVEYFNNNHGIKFTVGPSNLGSEHKYKFSVKDIDNNILEEIVEMKFYSQKIITSGPIKQLILDDDNNLWVLSFGNPSHIIKFKEKEGKFEEELKFEIDIDPSYSSYVGGSFFINPYNDLFYIPDYEGEEVDVYSKDGSLIKHIKIPLVDSDHPQNPHSSPVYIGFNMEGKGIISLQGKGISGRKWRFIDSSNDDLLTEPDENHPYYNTELTNFVLNLDKTKLYVLEDRTSKIKILNGEGNFEEINLNDLFPGVADSSSIVQNRLNNKVFLTGLYNSEIIATDLSYISNINYKSYLGDFCYDSNRPNNIYALDEDSNFKLLDFDNKKDVLDLPLDSRFNWTHGRGIVTTPDDKFVITYSDRVNNSTSDSQIVIYNTEMFK